MICFCVFSDIYCLFVLLCFLVIFAVYCDENGSHVTCQSMSAMVSACEKTALPHEAHSLFKAVSHNLFISRYRANMHYETGIMAAICL